MNHVVFRTCLAVLAGLVLAATGGWASPAGEEQPAAAMDKEMVRDPATGKMVTAPEYGGTLTYPYHLTSDTTDVRDAHYAVFLISGVNGAARLGRLGTG